MTLFVGTEVGAASFASARAQIDDLQITTPDGPVPPPVPPSTAPPGVTISAPAPETITSTRELTITGTASASGGALGFCAAVGNGTALPVPCGEASRTAAPLCPIRRSPARPGATAPR